MKANEARRTPWRARFADPDTGATKYEKFPPHVTTAEAREEWAVRKSTAISMRATELDLGAPRATGTALTTAIARYFTAHPQLRERTRAGYRDAADKLESWAKKHRVESADELTRARLLAFRESLVAEPKKTAKKGGKVLTTERTRAPATINRELRAVRTALGYLRDLDLLPRASHDEVCRALKRMAGTAERMEFLRPAQIQAVIAAAKKHDADCFKETRAEHTGDGRKSIGTTARYTPILPFVSFVLLTGCRLAEALTLEWAGMDLDALDHDRKAVGEVHLRGAATKTHRARTIGLEVSPALRSVLAAMRPENVAGSVFGVSPEMAKAAARRLLADYGTPESFGWQALRRTCGTFLTNAPGIFGAASAYRSAKQLGHSVTVAEKHYVGLVRGIPPTAKTLEDAMGVSQCLVVSDP